MIKCRHAEHTRSIHNKDNISALSTHLITSHPTLEPNMNIYSVKILQCYKDSIDACLAESVHISLEKPSINRKHEGANELV